MIDDAGGNFLHIKVSHHISADYHCTFLCIESINDDLQAMFVFIHVIAIKLDGKLSAFLVMDTYVPTSAYTEVISFGNDVNQPLVRTKFMENFTGPVCRMIVDDNDIERKGRLLVQCRAYGIFDCANTVAYGYNDRSFIFKSVGRKVYGTEDRIKISANFLQMVGACLFHFNLYLTVFRVYIIELLLTAFPLVTFYFGI